MKTMFSKMMLVSITLMGLTNSCITKDDSFFSSSSNVGTFYEGNTDDGNIGKPLTPVTTRILFKNVLYDNTNGLVFVESGNIHLKAGYTYRLSAGLGNVFMGGSYARFSFYDSKNEPTGSKMVIESATSGVNTNSTESSVAFIKADTDQYVSFRMTDAGGSASYFRSQLKVEVVSKN